MNNTTPYDKTINSQPTIELLKQIEEVCPEASDIYVIFDMRDKY